MKKCHECGSPMSKVKAHVRNDMKAYKKEYREDEELLHDIEKKKEKAPKGKKKDPVPKGKNKVKFVMNEFKRGELHSGSHEGPVVQNPKQAIAIALSMKRRKNPPSRKASAGQDGR